MNWQPNAAIVGFSIAYVAGVVSLALGIHTKVKYMRASTELPVGGVTAPVGTPVITNPSSTDKARVSEGRLFVGAVNYHVNIPISVSMEDFLLYGAVPALPEGVYVFDGVIQGKPEKTHRRRTHVITGYNIFDIQLPLSENFSSSTTGTYELLTPTSSGGSHTFFEEAQLSVSGATMVAVPGAQPDLPLTWVAEQGWGLTITPEVPLTQYLFAQDVRMVVEFEHILDRLEGDTHDIVVLRFGQVRVSLHWRKTLRHLVIRGSYGPGTPESDSPLHGLIASQWEVRLRTYTLMRKTYHHFGLIINKRGVLESLRMSGEQLIPESLGEIDLIRRDDRRNEFPIRVCFPHPRGTRRLRRLMIFRPAQTVTTERRWRKWKPSTVHVPIEELRAVLVDIRVDNQPNVILDNDSLEAIIQSETDKNNKYVFDYKGAAEIYYGGVIIGVVLLVCAAILTVVYFRQRRITSIRQ
jgi:hypothetical protein